MRVAHWKLHRKFWWYWGTFGVVLESFLNCISSDWTVIIFATKNHLNSFRLFDSSALNLIIKHVSNAVSPTWNPELWFPLCLAWRYSSRSFPLSLPSCPPGPVPLEQQLLLLQVFIQPCFDVGVQPVQNFNSPLVHRRRRRQKVLPIHKNGHPASQPAS